MDIVTGLLQVIPLLEVWHHPTMYDIIGTVGITAPFLIIGIIVWIVSKSRANQSHNDE